MSKDLGRRPYSIILNSWDMETVARRRSAALLSEFGLGHVREYTPFGLGALRAPCPHPQALHLILRARSQHICFKCARMALRATFSYDYSYCYTYTDCIVNTTDKSVPQIRGQMVFVQQPKKSNSYVVKSLVATKHLLSCNSPIA